MKMFAIEIKETLSKIIDIESNSVEEVISKVKELYENEEIILHSENYIQTEINQLVNEDK